MTPPEIRAAIEELRHATRPEQRTSYERALLALADLVDEMTRPRRCAQRETTQLNGLRAAVSCPEVPMSPATHVLWGGRVQCGNPRLSGYPVDWPEGQRWISLKDVTDGSEPPSDRCEACWTEAVETIAALRRGVEQ